VSTKPHDALFRGTFSNPDNARGELQHMLPPGLAALIDWSTLKPSPATFIDEAFRESYSDLLFTVQIDGSAAFVYLLFEHQSTADRMLVFRQLKYEVNIWSDWSKEHPHAGKLPVIIPLLLCHCPAPWTAATRFEDLLDIDPGKIPLVADFIPKFRVLVDDLTTEKDEALRARAMTAAGRLALCSLRTARNTAELCALFPKWAALLEELRREPNTTAVDLVKAR